MIAVGVGIAPMIHTLRSIFKDIEYTCSLSSSPSSEPRHKSTIERIVVLYGVRTVADILLREQLDTWQVQYADLFKIVYCVGSRWDNVHWGSKKKTEYVAPSLPTGFQSLSCAELVMLFISS
jgi:NAD(P)H-flavin reductase